MLKRLTQFLKYNNAALLILAVIFLVGTGALATETGRTALGQRQTSVEGVDNTLLLEADLDNFNMDYKIERIEADEDYYYVTYTYIDLVLNNNVWQYQMQEDVRKVALDIEKDLGVYLAEELAEEYEARIAELKGEQAREEAVGETKRVEVTDFSGLLGGTLDLAGRMFPNYEPVTKQELPSPIMPPNLSYLQTTNPNIVSTPDSLTEIYEDFISENDPDRDNWFGDADNCPDIPNPKQEDSDQDGIGDACDTEDTTVEPETVDDDTATSGEEIIESVDDKTATPTEEVINEEQPVSEETGTKTVTEETVSEEPVTEEPDVEIIELPAGNTMGSGI